MKRLKKFIIICTLPLLTACGAKKTVYFNGSEQEQILNSTNGALAMCNQFNNGVMSGNVQLYSNDFGQIIPETLEAKLDANVATLVSSGKVIRFFKWYANPDGTTFISSDSIQLTIKNIYMNTLVTGLWSELSQAKINEFINTHGLGSMTVAQFFEQHTVVLTDVELQYDVVRVTAFDGSMKTAEVDFLAPQFSADPNKYFSSHHTLLHSLHPNFTVSQVGMTEQQYLGRLTEFCF